LLTFDGSVSQLLEAGGTAPSCSLPDSASAYSSRIDTLGGILDTLVTKFENNYGVTSGKIGCPAVGASGEQSAQWGRYAYTKLARGTDAAGTTLALSALSCMFKYQDNKSTDSTYGVFRFHVDDSPNPQDNSTEFALEPVGWMLARGMVPAATLSTLSGQIRAGLDAMDAHETCTNYTNICLLQQGIRLSIGAAFAASSDSTLAADGRSRIAKAKSELGSWGSTVKSGGIREFDSPTYGEIQLQALLLAHQGAVLARDGGAQAMVDGALDYVWSDFAANVVPSRGALAPPYSRTYDFGGGQGVLGYGLWLEGLIPTQPLVTTDMQEAAWLTTTATNGYRPPSGALCWAAQPTRTVVSEFQQSGQTHLSRQVYVTADFSLGATTGDFPVGSNIDDDLLVGGSLVSTPTTPLLSVLPDWLDAPLGAVNAGNFNKVTHLELDPVSVQKDGAVLVLARIPAADPHYTSTSGGSVSLVNLTTNLIVPAMVDAVLVDGTKIDPTKTGTANALPVVVAQNGTGVMGMAVIQASGLDCVTSSGSITETGADHVDVLPLAVPSEDAALRLAIRHVDSPPSNTATLNSCFARVALLMVGRHCDASGCGATLSTDLATAVSGAQATFDKSTGNWSVTVQAPGGSSLHVARPMAMGGMVTTATVDGAAPTIVPLSVNGTKVPLQP
jgi:hypothetical protein